MTILRNYFSGYREAGGIKELLTLAVPMIISTACDGVMTFTDRLFLARVGSEQMNAAMGGGVTMQMLMFFFIGLAGYSTALVAQYFGAGENHHSSRAAFQAILVTLLAWPAILLLKPLAVGFFDLMNIPESQAGYQVQYLNILAWGGVFTMMRYTLGCYFTGIGQTKVVMTATIAAMIVNVALDYILIFGKLGFPAMGIEGAGLATVSGAFFALLVLAGAYFRRENRMRFSVMKSFRFDWQIMKRLLYYGYPAGVEMFLNFLAFTTMISLFHSQGEMVATASTIMFNWDLVSFIPLLGIEMAVMSLVGRYMGAGKPDMAHRSAISAIKTGIFYSVVILALFVLIPEALVRVFHPLEPSAIFEEAVPVAVAMVRIAALYVLAEAIMVALVGALRGAGDTHFTMIASVSMHWLIVPVLYLSLNIFHLSVAVSWLLLVIMFLLFCTVLIFRFRGSKWKQIRVIGG
ncbi:MATE family efflux transporter [Gaoshiqia sp. Z1-71]|uniref:MATE family efflux transporter n=1 Tax=Gaoshiqia hydrogeniformans TaxID=3290090 RepID=UPI003BF8B695